MASSAADLERNQLHRDIELRCHTAIQAANIPLTVSETARRAHVTRFQASRALTQLVADGRVQHVWDEPRQIDAYTTGP
jgi:predicted transcriptional regulator